MDITSLSSSSNNSILALFKQRRDAMTAMEAAVQSGDIQTAQQDLATVQQDSHNIQSATGTSSNQQNPYQSTMKTDLTNLMNAVQSGDISTAQSALQTLQQDSQTADPDGNNSTSGSASQSGSQFLNDLTNLLTAVTSGNTSAAQSAASALEQDVQVAFGATTPSTSADTASSNSTDSTSTGTTSSGTATTASTSSTSGQSQNSFLNDVQALITAAESNDTAGAQTAAQNLAQDIQNAINGSTDDQVEGHHHHHHHHGQLASANSTSSTTTGTGSSSTTASAANSTGSSGSSSSASQGNDSDGDSQGNQASPPFASGISGALKNAQDAYELLMSFSQQTTASA
jgi:hypothetical protein